MANQKKAKPTTKTKASTKKTKTKAKSTSTKKTTKTKSSAKSSSKFTLLSYSCIHRKYLITNPETKETKEKRMWIVIGDGHKWYRKFDTQAEGINYFRALKKHAKMRIQSVKSKEFIKTIYTFMEMERIGVNVKEIETKNKIVAEEKKVIDNNEEEDFEDEFSKFDVIDEDYDDFDHSKVDEILSEKEGEIFVNEKSDEIEIKTEEFDETYENDYDEDKIEKTVLISSSKPENEIDEDIEIIYQKVK